MEEMTGRTQEPAEHMEVLRARFRSAKTQRY